MATLSLGSQGQPLEINKLSKIQINHAIHASTRSKPETYDYDYAKPTKRISKPYKTIANLFPKTTTQSNSTHTFTIPELTLNALNFPRLGIKLSPLSRPFHPNSPTHNDHPCLTIRTPVHPHKPARPQIDPQKSDPARNVGTSLSLDIHINGSNTNVLYTFRTSAYTVEPHTMTNAHIAYPHVTKSLIII